MENEKVTILWDFQVKTDRHIHVTRIPFSQKPTSCLLIESQTLKIWPGNDVDLGVTLTSDKSNQVKTDVQVAKLALSMRWPWPNDLDTQTWPRYCKDVPPHQK